MDSLRQLILIPALLILLLGTAFAEQHEGYYAGAAYGVAYTDAVAAKDDLGRFYLNGDLGGAYVLSLGYDLPAGGRFGNGRVELAYSQSTHDFTTAEFSSGEVAASGSLLVQRLMLNSFATFREDHALTPYLGVGLGAAQVRLDKLKIIGSPLIDDEDLVFAAQFGCGITTDLTSWLRLDLGYRYSYIQAPELAETDGRKVKLDVNSHLGLLGLVYLF